ncbi:hypothetical protein [Streptomyces sp. NPDC003635]
MSGTFGDDKYARYETLDGCSVVHDADRGAYCYAETDSAGADRRFVSSGIPHPVLPTPPGRRAVTSQPPSPLAPLLGDAVAGGWKLRISDAVQGSTGVPRDGKITVRTGT